MYELSVCQPSLPRSDLPVTPNLDAQDIDVQGEHG